MAQNGWYIEKITTDLQTGKVDEFIKKEGKWFNYIKGEETTFTSAADNGGASSGNIDTQEFTVQGIGAIIADATVVDGDEPTLGGTVSISSTQDISFSFTNITLNNITTLPSSTTTTIIPNPTFALDAANFSIDSSYTLPSWIDTVTFSNTGTPGALSNTIEVLIQFNTTNITSGTTLSATLEIINSNLNQNTTTWEGSINVIGQFDSVYGAQNSFVYSGSFVTETGFIPNTNIEQTNIASCLTFAGVDSNVITLSAISGSHTVFGNPSVNLNLNNPAEVSQYTTNVISTPSTAQIEVLYNPDGTQLTDGNNEITINLDASPATLVFSGSPVLDPAGGQVFIPITNDFQNVNYTVTSSNSNYIVSPYDENNVLLNYPANSGSSNVNFSLNIFSQYNNSSTPNHTISLSHSFLTTPSVTIGAQIESINPTTGALEIAPSVWTYFTSLDGSGTNPIVENFGNQITVRSEATGAIVNNFPSSGLQFTHPTWVSEVLTSSAGNVTTTVFQVDPNTTTSTRTGVIGISHPDDSSVTNSLTVTQEAGYSSSANTLTFKKEDTTPSTYVDAGVQINLDENAQTVQLFVDVPLADITSENYWNITYNIPDYPSFTKTFPMIWELPDGFGGYQTNQDAGLTNWIDNWNVSFTGTSIDQQFMIEFDLSQNENVVTSQNNFPVDRSFTIKGFNPENSSSGHDDTIEIYQTAPAKSMWDSLLGAEVDYTYLPLNNLLGYSNGTTAPTIQGYGVYEGGSWTYGVGITPLWNIGGGLSATQVSSTVQYEVPIYLEDNFSGSERKWEIGIYHPTADTTLPPTTQGNLADSIIVKQQSSTAVIGLTSHPFDSTVPPWATAAYPGANITAYSIPTTFGTTSIDLYHTINGTANPTVHYLGGDGIAAYYEGNTDVTVAGAVPSWISNGFTNFTTGSNSVASFNLVPHASEVRVATFAVLHYNNPNEVMVIALIIYPNSF